MFCHLCGYHAADDMVFCPQCGTKLLTQEQVADQEPAYRQPDVFRTAVDLPEDKYRGHPMKWHKFLVYAWLWLGVLCETCLGVGNLLLLTAGRDGDGEGLYVGKIVYYFLMILLAGVDVYTALRLLRLKANAFEVLIIDYALSLALDVFYIFLLPGEKMLNGVLGLAISVIWMIATCIYYKKREDVFVN